MLKHMTPRERMRAADADREAVVERLREAVSEGRLDLDEFDQRLSRAYSAKTYGELDRVLADLPGPAPSLRPQPPSPTRQQRHVVRGWLAEQWRPWATVVSICVAVWVLTAILTLSLPYFWPMWVAVPWGMVLVFRSVGGLRSGEPQRWATRHQAGPPRQ
jgi:hypothetical protein